NNLDIHGVGTNVPGYEVAWNCYSRLISHDMKKLPNGVEYYDKDKFTPELAEDMKIGDMSATFKLRKDAKFSDGTPVTAADVINSFNLLKEKGSPAIGLALREVIKAEAPDDATVQYTFQGALVRDLPVILAGLPVLSKAYYDKKPFDETSLEPPLGSGPYLISDFKAGTYVTYKRRDDYWAKDLPVNRGRYNLDEIRFDSFRDRTAELEAIKSGGLDYREEFTSVDWATGYNVAAVKNGRLIRDTLPDANPSGAQGFFLNTRRDKFKDVRVREALDQAFDFEWSNKKLFYNLYTRTQSFFENSDMKATGKPSPQEVALLEPFKDKVPAGVFGEVYSPPVTDGSGNNRENLRKAFDLLKAAGWSIGPDRLQHNAKGETLDIEFLFFEDAFERIIQPYVENLRKIGVNATARRVDPAQYERRMKSFDFDVTVQRYVLRLTPGVELRGYWGSRSATMDGSQNLSGIADPVIDALIDKVTAAKSREELVTATRSIDRVLRGSHYWVPHWYKPVHNVAYWDKYSRPATNAKYDPGVLDTWWCDKAKADALTQKSAPGEATK
ncbi:MAG: ABC transporter substrate-binding protein, partial [Hyphomicrobiaceae bacterium]|nr:ABC transporter substrate-binding protein [Hyphomicrobiaceae bacterium]